MILKDGKGRNPQSRGDRRAGNTYLQTFQSGGQEVTILSFLFLHSAKSFPIQTADRNRHTAVYIRGPLKSLRTEGTR